MLLHNASLANLLTFRLPLIPQQEGQFCRHLRGLQLRLAGELPSTPVPRKGNNIVRSAGSYEIYRVSYVI